MFELSVARKYLLPRRRQLSVSIISIISILVISLVVWLIVVFFSVTDGLEKSWIQKLTALTAPIRVTPTDAYYHSYYYQIDAISNASGYNNKTIKEKLENLDSDPYDPDMDEEIPIYWPGADRDHSGKLKNLVKLAYQSINEVKGTPAKAQDFELTGSHLHLKLIRDHSPSEQNSAYPSSTRSSLTLPTFLGNFESDNLNLTQTLFPIESKDLTNILKLLALNEDPTQEENRSVRGTFPPVILQKRLNTFFDHVQVTHLQTKQNGWSLPKGLIPSDIRWTVSALFKDARQLKIIVPLNANETGLIAKAYEDEHDVRIVTGHIYFNSNHQLVLDIPQEDSLTLLPHLPIIVPAGKKFPAKLNPDSILKAKQSDHLTFSIQLPIQGSIVEGNIPYRGLEIGQANLNHSILNETQEPPSWIYQSKLSDKTLINTLPKDPEIGDGLLLPKGFKEAGVLVGDRGYLTYVSPTASIIQEQRLPIYVAGFYDPGIIPIGGKFILVNRDILSIIHDAHSQENNGITSNGINVRFKDYHSADQVKAQILQSFKDKGISRYWKVETFREYEFTKEIMRELQSQKSLFTLIAVVIIIVACSNIISMLIILVNDKRLEIGILRSMGASSKSIALIFGLSGALIGIMGSLIGIVCAILTLRNLNVLINLMSQIQGNDLLNAALYGEMITHELSYEALSFVLIATMIISLIAGIIPAIKASLLKPSDILRSTG